MKVVIPLIAAVLACTGLQAQTQAEAPANWEGGSGGEISKLSHLLWLSETREAWDENWVLTANIDAGETESWNSGDHDNDATTDPENMGFLPIAMDDEFTGSFDGQGYQINQLYINRPGERGMGLFQALNKAEVINLKLNEVWIKGKNRCGGIAAESSESNIEGCFVSGRVIGTRDIGGLIGYSYDDLIKACVTECTVEASENQVGGLIGGSTSAVQNCRAKGTVICEGHYCGGLIGTQTEGEVKACESQGTVRANYDVVGGLIGQTQNTLVEACSSSASVAGDNMIGGLIGYIDDNTRVLQSTTYTYVHGHNRVGGLIGAMRGNETDIDDCNTYRLTSSSLGSYVGGLVGLVISARSITDSHAMGMVRGKTDVGGLIGKAGNVDWITNCMAFGNVNGNEYVGGLIGTNGAPFKNCAASGIVNGYDNVGGLTGYNTSSGMIVNSCFAGSVTAYDQAGGITGLNNQGYINNTASTGLIRGWDMVGGIVGFTMGGEIENSYASGLIIGHNYVGGITGKNNNGSYGACWYDIWNTRCWVAFGFDRDAIKSALSDTMGLTTDEFKTTDLGFPLGNNDDNPWKLDEMGRPYFYWEKAKVSNSLVDSTRAYIEASLTLNGAEIQKTGVRYMAYSDTIWSFQSLSREGTTFSGTISNLIKDTVYIVQPYAMDIDSMYYFGDMVSFTAQKTTVSVREELSSDLKLYPNPVSSTLLIDHRGAEAIMQVSIFDMEGRMIYQKSSQSPEGIRSLNLSWIPQGIYLLRALNKEGLYHSDLIIRSDQ